MVEIGHSQKSISVVIPVFQNRETLEPTCLQILEVQKNAFPELMLQLVFVDDGSEDGSWDELKRLRHLFPEYITLVKLTRNFGQLSAILAGYESATGDAIITISADLQDPISLMEQMVLQWKKGNEVVIAYRESRKDGFMASAFSRLAYSLAHSSNKRMPKGGFDYLLLSKRAAKHVVSFNGRHRFFQGDILWLGLPTAFIPYARQERKHGKSTWTFKKKLKFGIDLVLDSSYLPIRLMSSVGTFIAFLGLLYAGVIVFSWFKSQTPFSGWAPLMVVILVIGGLIMMMLSIIGEYLYRIYDDIRGKPLYIVEAVELNYTEH